MQLRDDAIAIYDSALRYACRRSRSKGWRRDDGCKKNTAPAARIVAAKWNART
jgi:hypothetical protein